MKKEIKIRDLISYLFSNDNQIPEEFIFQEKNVKRYVNYLFEYIWHFPKMIEYFQKYNHLYNREIEANVFEFLKFFKHILKDNNISRYQFQSEFFNFYQELQKVKKLEDESIKQKRQLIDIVTELKLASIMNQKVKLNEIKNVKSKDENKNNIKQKIEEAQKHQEKEIAKQTQTRKTILTEINEEVIKNLELTLIDIFVDDKKNQLIYTFLDKNFKKCYYVESFNYDFYISKNFGIINNDFLEEYNSEKFIKYTVFNYWNYNNLRRAINNNYKKFMLQ